jgi:hypothetical protein
LAKNTRGASKRFSEEKEEVQKSEEQRRVYQKANQKANK